MRIVILDTLRSSVFYHNARMTFGGFRPRLFSVPWTIQIKTASCWMLHPDNKAARCLQCQTVKVCPAELWVECRMTLLKGHNICLDLLSVCQKPLGRLPVQTDSLPFLNNSPLFFFFLIFLFMNEIYFGWMSSKLRQCVMQNMSDSDGRLCQICFIQE